MLFLRQGERALISGTYYLRYMETFAAKPATARVSDDERAVPRRRAD